MTASAGQWGDLSQRLLSGAVAAIVGLLAMWWGGLAFQLLVAVISGIMVWELARMTGAGSLSVPFGILSGFILYFLVSLPVGIALPLLFLPALLGIAMLNENRVIFAIYTLLILIAGFGLVSLRIDFGFLWMAWLALVVIASDIMGYFAGRFIGGPKFWPKVSPKKTWSGTIAGWIGAALVGAVLMLMGKASAEIIGISIALAIAGQFGDVAESALKRQMGVKDSSNILPGHGGMFDRFDAMLGASLFLLLIGQVINFPPIPA